MLFLNICHNWEHLSTSTRKSLNSAWFEAIFKTFDPHLRSPSASSPTSIQHHRKPSSTLISSLLYQTNIHCYKCQVFVYPFCLGRHKWCSDAISTKLGERDTNSAAIRIRSYLRRDGYTLPLVKISLWQKVILTCEHLVAVFNFLSLVFDCILKFVVFS